MLNFLLRIRKNQILTIEYLTVIVGFLFYTGAMEALLVKSFGIPRQIMTLMRYGITLPGLFLIVTQPKRVLECLIQGKFAWLLMLLASLSFLWSPNPSIPTSSIRSELVPMALFSLFVAIRIPLKVQFLLMSFVLQFVSFTSVFYAVAVPSIGVHQEKWPGAWKGLFFHKNSFGASMTLTAGILFIYLLKSHKRQLIQFLPLGITLGAAILSGSLGALILSQVFCCLIFAISLLKWRGKQGLMWTYLGVVGTFLGLGVLLAIWNPLLTGLGKDPTISARTEIWESARMQLAENPVTLLLGFGRGVAWKTPTFIYRVYLHSGDAPANAHNGFFEMALDLGYVGLSIFIIGHLTAMAKALKLSYQSPRPEHLWPVAFLVYILMQNYLESFLMRAEQLNWVMFLIMSSSLDRWNHEREWLNQKEKRRSVWERWQQQQQPQAALASSQQPDEQPGDPSFQRVQMKAWDRIATPNFTPRRLAAQERTRTTQPTSTDS